jgi:hypothetical protein
MNPVSLKPYRYYLRRTNMILDQAIFDHIDYHVYNMTDIPMNELYHHIEFELFKDNEQ